MLPHFRPEPDDAERKAIVAALAVEEAEQAPVSEWSAVFLAGLDDKQP